MKPIRCIILAGIALAIAAFALPAQAGQPVYEILQNGEVFPSPQYPYTGNKYLYERVPGDSDMYWLRNFATEQGIFASIDFGLDWKDREFDMMKALAWWTSHHMAWSGENNYPVEGRRAKDILNICVSHADAVFGCGDITYATIGLAQAHGIPARAISCRDYNIPPNGDYIVEFYSTRYNRWILFFEKGYGWIEHETEGPLGMRELKAYDAEAPIEVWWNELEEQWEALSRPPLIFMPSRVSKAPIAPFNSEQWNMGRWQLFGYNWRVNPNAHYPDCCAEGSSELYLGSDPFINIQNQLIGNNFSVPIVPIDDPQANYKLNNVQASVAPIPGGLNVFLKRNMFEFVRYEMKGPYPIWKTLPTLQVGGTTSLFVWKPLTVPATLQIRGVNIANVHSPDVVIRLNSFPEISTSRGRGELKQEAD